MFRSSKDLSFKKQEKVTNSSDDYLRCDMCKKGSWTSQTDVDIHRKLAHKWDLLLALKNKKAAMCSICLHEQNDKKSLREHILENHLCCPPNATIINREIFICDYCNRLFFNKQLLITHMYHWHTKKTPENANVEYNCPKCWKNIKGKSAWFHLLYHGVHNIETCPICLETFDSHSQMLEHVKTHPYTFRCDICNYQTTKEFYFNNHLTKHEAMLSDCTDDVSQFFLPKKLLPSLNNRMYNLFKGIPLANEVKICILCRTLCFSEEEMRQHIYGAHVPKKDETIRKTHQCYCGEVFFNKVLLKHHVFKLKGNHGVWDGVSPIPKPVPDQEPVVFEVYGLSNSLDMNDIIITGLTNYSESEENESSNNDYQITKMEN